MAHAGAKQSTPIIVIFLAAALAACGNATAAPGDATSTIAATNQPAASQPTLTSAAPTAELPASAAPPIATTLTADGPWLVFNTSQGLFAANTDGSVVTRLVGSPAIAAPRDLRVAVAPNGGRMALIYSEEGVGLSLHMITLPDGADTLITVLRSPPPDVPAGYRDEVVEAIVNEGSLAWSPDGSMLAFIGGMNGPSADVYVYRTADGSITQLTNGDSQAYQLSWSPDGKYILHAGAGSFGTGAGYSMEGVWAARADGSEVKTLYTPTSVNEIFVGWVTPTTFLVYSGDAMCGAHDLRTFDIESGREAARVVSYFNGDGVAMDAVSGTVIFSADEIVAGCNEDKTAGTFRLNLGELGTTQTTSEVARKIVFAPQVGAFFGQTETGAVEIKQDGTAAPLDSPARSVPLISPDGRFWAWHSDGFITSPGAWIGPFHGDTAEISGDSVRAAIWSMDSQYLFFVSANGMYRVNAGMTLLTPIATPSIDVIDVNTIAWVTQ